MAFIKEYVSEKDKELYNSFQIYDYEQNEILRWNNCPKWSVDREREIYFTRVSGFRREAPAQYDLIWKGEKIVIEAYVVCTKNPSTNPPTKERIWDIVHIRTPKCLRDCNDELVELIKEVIEFDHSIDVDSDGEYYEATSKLVIRKFVEPSYYEEVM